MSQFNPVPCSHQREVYINLLTHNSRPQSDQAVATTTTTGEMTEDQQDDNENQSQKSDTSGSRRQLDVNLHVVKSKKGLGKGLMSIVRKAISPSQTKKKKPSSKNRRCKNGSPDQYSNGSLDCHDREVNMIETNTTYNVSLHRRASKRGALVDRGANGGVAGADTHIISRTGRTVDITGIDEHQLNSIPIGTCGAVVPTIKGEAIIIMHEYALFGKGQTIHSSGQIEHYRNLVHDKSMKVGGLQCIITSHFLSLPPVLSLFWMGTRPRYS